MRHLRVTRHYARRLDDYKGKRTYSYPVLIRCNDSSQLATIAEVLIHVTAQSLPDAVNWAREQMELRPETEVIGWGPKGGECYRYVGWYTAIGARLWRAPSGQLALFAEGKMEKQDNLRQRINDGEALTDCEAGELLRLLGKGCRQRTKERLWSVLRWGVPNIPCYGIYERVLINPRVQYVARQSYPDEIRTVRELLIGR